MIAVYILLDSRQSLMLIVYTIFNTALCLSEIYLREDFRKHMKGMIVLRALDYLVLADTTLNRKPTPKGTTPFKTPWSRLIILSRPSTGPISLPDDDDADDLLEMGVGDDDPAPPSHAPWEIPPDLVEDVLHWSQLSTQWDTHKALWISSDQKERHKTIALAVSRLLTSSTDKNTRTSVAVVDVAQTRSVFWPLTRGLAAALPEYRAALGDDPPSVIRDNSVHVPRLHAGKPDLSPWLYYDSNSGIIAKLITRHLYDIYKELDKARGSDLDSSDLQSARVPGPPRITLIIHGIRNNDQGDEVSDTIDKLEVKLKKLYKYVSIVAISSSKILRHVSDDDTVIMDYVCTLFVSESGNIIYSGKSPAPPAFYKNIFLLLVDGIHRTGGVRAEKLWSQLSNLALSGADVDQEDDVEDANETSSIFSALYKASQVRTQILELLSKIKVVSRSRINKRLLQDNAQIVGLLQRLVKHNLYKKDIQNLPREHAIALLNLTHYTLNRGLPDKVVVKDHKQFTLRTHRLLNWLAAYLQLLPDELAVHDVKLLSDHPIKHGGFSNIYHGKYKDPDGEEVEVALKVLKIFEEQSDEHRLLLHTKFTKEALVWHHLQHKNIVKFIGVDSATFPSPARAMVSPWMPLGSFLKYITEFSPSSMYALDVLCDIIEGLKYLHSVNVVHGDLCGRNILMDKRGRAMLTDFGLASFVDSDVTMKTSTRSGSIRWMAPELVLPPPGVAFKRTPESDIWAFGCVCCEIWSEGDVPFKDLGSDTGVIFAFSDEGEPALPYHPYAHATRPASPCPTSCGSSCCGASSTVPRIALPCRCWRMCCRMLRKRKNRNPT
ncbi:hypothetical protein B0H15DRAFT_895297 [Mycena belliarum]|uniref:Protein kinase domain-containing protein n=1 Tax=Mycena belliarum TaxID=1033014 RepID=A0AAD6TPN2_9AGAR|nr:hypothetical protein B0H15DRAFT_895297 [Mycena belliae]